MDEANKIVDKMKEEMPFFFHDGIRPYIIEAMKIYANHKLILADLQMSKYGTLKKPSSLKDKI